MSVSVAVCEGEGFLSTVSTVENKSQRSHAQLFTRMHTYIHIHIHMYAYAITFGRIVFSIFCFEFCLLYGLYVLHLQRFCNIVHKYFAYFIVTSLQCESYGTDGQVHRQRILNKSFLCMYD